MTTAQTQIPWEPKTEEKYLAMIKKIPLFHREIAQQVVEKKSQQLAQARGSVRVEEPDIVGAFFSEVPKAFYSLMIRLLDEAEFDYAKHIKPESQAK